MNTATASIIDTLGKFDAATLYEAAGQTGMVDPTIRPAWPGAKLCGLVMTVDCPPGDNLMLHQAVAQAPEGAVLVAALGSYMLKGAWGEILTVAAQQRGVAGLAVDGAVRDIDAIAELGFPIFSRGLAIGACTKERWGSLNKPILFGGLTVHSGDAIVGTSDGIVIIESRRIEEVCEAALKRQNREAEIMAELRGGKTTIEILGLPTEPGAGKK